MRLFLSIDAGGTKGMFSFAFLKCLTSVVPTLAIEGVVGVSIGACLAAFLCCDLMETLTVEHLLPLVAQLGQTWPGAARSTYIYEQVCAIFGTRRLGDIRPDRALYILAVNATTGVPVMFSSREVAHRHLLLSSVVYASMTIPLCMPLSRIGGHTYIDGGFATSSPICTTYFLAREQGLEES
jgi:predicted acylesterase/phospholipase RssA